MLKKYSVLISYVFQENLQDISRTFSFIAFFPGLFEAWKFIFSFSRFSRFSRVCGNPGNRGLTLITSLTNSFDAQAISWYYGSQNGLGGCSPPRSFHSWFY